MTTKGLLRKEIMEAARTYKILIIPLVLLILGVSQPISYHFMPEILKSTAMPEGTIIQIPAPPPPQIIVTVLDQYGKMGILFIILAAMGIVAKEIEMGQAAFVLTLGVRRSAYLLTKWTVLSAVVVGAVLIGVWGSAYYTVALFGPLSWGNVTLAAVMYSLYCVFILTATMALGTIFPNQLITGGLTLSLPILFSIVGLISSAAGDYLPTNMSAVAADILNGSSATVWQGVGVSLAWIMAFLLLAHYVLSRREL